MGLYQEWWNLFYGTQVWLYRWFQKCNCIRRIRRWIRNNPYWLRIYPLRQLIHNIFNLGWVSSLILTYIFFYFNDLRPVIILNVYIVSFSFAKWTNLIRTVQAVKPLFYREFTAWSLMLYYSEVSLLWQLGRQFGLVNQTLSYLV